MLRPPLTLGARGALESRGDGSRAQHAEAHLARGRGRIRHRGRVVRLGLVRAGARLRAHRLRSERGRLQIVQAVAVA